MQHRTRVPWIRGLRLYRTNRDDAALASSLHDRDEGSPEGHVHVPEGHVHVPEGHVHVPEGHVHVPEGHVHARSRFRSVRHPDRYATYSVHEPGEAILETPGDHTLAVVREFRRVPLRASALALVLFAARLGREAQVVATLAHFAERALSHYQPPYLLLARSLEQPGISALLTGVQATSVLDSAMATPFSVDHMLPEVTPLLAAEPELYAYAPELARESVVSAVSPYAV